MASPSSRGKKLAVTKERPERLESLERGLRALALFGGGAGGLSMIEVAEALAITRASAGRVLNTLVDLGYLREDARAYRLTPKVLSLGYAYLASIGFRGVAQPLLEELAQQTGESCSLGVLDGADVVYVLRAEAKKLVRFDVNVGSRLPAHLNSMGRVLLGALPDAALTAHLKRLQLTALTSKTITDRALLKKEITKAREQGWCYIADEVEEGIRGLAAPVIDAQGRTVAALNLSLGFTRRPFAEVRARALPLLQEATRALNNVVGAGLKPPA